KWAFAVLLLFLVVSVASSLSNYRDKFSEGDRGTICLSCAVVITSLERYILFKEPNIEKAISKYCDLFGGKVASICRVFIAVEARPLLILLKNKQKPDAVCKALGFCRGYEHCQLHPVDGETKFETAQLRKDPWWLPLIQPFLDALKNHVPLVDGDGDLFSTIDTFRGSAWRGKDCDDRSRDIYPGRKVQDRDPDVDSDCNGIKGTSPSGQSYEDLYCSKTTRRGVAILGDSAGAHFRLPPQLLEPAYINATIYSSVPRIAELEADWPHLSWVTSFTEDKTGVTPGPSQSIYKKLKKRNRCNHRDYQNISVNGARSGTMKDISKTLSRNQTQDHPMLLFYALVGNDVCNGHPGDPGTPVDQFRQNVEATLDHLDTILPKGSYVVFEGLAVGGKLYEILQNETHPLGAPYPMVYDFLTCVKRNPCYGWMNTNETIRAKTTSHAEELSAVYQKIINEKSYNNFKMIYHDFPFEDVIPHVKTAWKEMIEPFDGFHPSQLLGSLTADVIWDFLEKNHPDAIGEVNPYNDKIEELFGDQGGY
ncbi:acyloxyacyl hydrolase, partial [Acrasis kona]